MTDNTQNIDRKTYLLGCVLSGIFTNERHSVDVAGYCSDVHAENWAKFAVKLVDKSIKEMGKLEIE